MSLLLFGQWSDSALIVSDTLVTDERQRPLTFASKVWTFPHLNMVFGMVGNTAVANAWATFINSGLICRDIEGMNHTAPDELRKILREYVQIFGPLQSQQSFFHFGFPRGSDQLVSYTYRSEADFVPERFEGSRFGAQPGPRNSKLTAPADRDGYVELATRIRTENDQGVAPDYIPGAIGGELYATQLLNGSITTQLWHQFPDHNHTWQRALRNARGEEESKEGHTK